MTKALSIKNPGFLGSLSPRAIALADDFNRPNSTNLGVTSVGEAEWQELVGDWSIVSNRISTPNTNAVAVVDAKTPDVDASIDIHTGSTSGGRDALIFRCTDAQNWLRLSRYIHRSSTTSCDPIYEYTRWCREDDLGACADSTGCQNFFPTGCGSCPSCCCSDCCVPQSCSESSTVCDQNCTSTTSYTRRIYLHKMENGSLATLNFWNVSSLSKLRIRSVGDQVSLYRDDTLLSTITESFNMGATLHGVGRSAIGNRTGSALDNFDLALVE